MIKNISIFVAVIFLIFFSQSVYATMTCTVCQVGNCVCQITNCAAGGVRGWAASSCTGLWGLQYMFSGSTLTWAPSSQGTYSFRIDCAGATSDCVQVSVGALSPTTSTTTTTTIPSSGNLLGRVYIDANSNGKFDSGEILVQNPSANCNNSYNLTV